MKEDFNFKKVPQRDFLNPYILLALHWAGGDAKKKEVVNSLADKFTLSEELLKEKTKRAQMPLFDNRVAWAGLYLVNTGYIKKGGRGIWYLSDKGKEAVEVLIGEEEEALIKFRKKVSEEYKKIQKGKGAVEVLIDEGKKVFGKFREEVSEELTSPPKAKPKISSARKRGSASLSKEENLPFLEEEELSPLEEQMRRDLARITEEMDSYEFERLCLRLMKELGYKSVEPTSRSRDGGIDGIGFLEFGLVRFKVVLQVKKQTSNVGSEKIQAFSGAKKEPECGKGSLYNHI